MSLFVGRIPEKAQESDLEALFSKYGKLTRCDIKRGQSFNFGFIGYDTEEEARSVIEAHERDEFHLFDQRLVVELAKGQRASKDECFKCGSTDHWSRECPRRRSRSPKRSRSRDRRRSPSRDRYRRRSRSDSRDRKRRRDDSRDRGRDDSRDRRRRDDSRDRRDDRRGGR
ncbi:hypothetical protein EDD86DRAFT_196157, partial [Gorgonomyces haynaldii]